MPKTMTDSQLASELRWAATLHAENRPSAWLRLLRTFMEAPVKLVRAILIDPFACTISEVEVDGDNHRSYYPLLSHETQEVTLFTAAYPASLVGNDALFVDDEGLLKEPQRFFLVGGMQPFAGKGLIVGADADGAAADARTPKFFLDLTVRYVRFEGDKLVYTTTPWQREQQ